MWQVSARPDRLRFFFLIWGGQAFSLFGSMLVQFALVWWLTRTTGSATVLATAIIMTVLPQVVLGPLAGALVDRWNRRRVMIIADAAIAAGVLGLLLLFWFDRVQVWHVYALLIFRATGQAFHTPAILASTTLMVPERHLSRVAGMNQTLLGIANVLSPVVGAVLFELVPMPVILSVDVSTALLAILPLVFILIPQPERSDVREDAHVVRSLLQDIGQAFRLLRNWRGALLVLAVMALANFLLTPNLALMPLVVDQHFGGRALQFATLQSVSGIGVVAGGITLGVWGGFRRRILTGLLAVLLMGLAILAIGLTPPSGFKIAVGAIFIAGFMFPVMNGSLQAVMQATVPPEIQGRVFTFGLAATTAMAPLGLALAGPLAERIGVMTWVLASGAAMALLGLVSFLIPSLVNVESHRPRMPK